jgi:protein-tyrosine-phosphatase
MNLESVGGHVSPELAFATAVTAEPGRADRARVHAALGDPTRLGIAESLLFTDRWSASLGRGFGLASNLMAHHVSVLAAAGVVRRSRSEGDRRRVYLALTELGRRTVAGSAAVPQDGVVFVCTHNSARSQFAQAVWRARSRVPARSGGTHPAQRVHPEAVAAAARHNLDLASARPQHYRPGLNDRSLLVTVCDSADLELELSHTEHLHWSVPDPVRRGEPAAFEDALRLIEQRVAHLAAAVA